MVAIYAASKNWSLRPNIVLVEGTTDEALFSLANTLSENAGRQLLGDEICVVAAGRRDRGGTFGVARELITLRSMLPLVLDRTGRHAYRVLGLVDHDHAGRRIIQDLLRLDRGALEFRDILTIRPCTPTFSNSTPNARRDECDRVNLPYCRLDWEIEDALAPRLLKLFEQRHPRLAPKKLSQGGKTHHDFTSEAKTALHRFVHEEATLQDLDEIVEIVRMLRSMFSLSPLVP